MTFLLILCLLGTAAWVAAGIVRERVAPGPRDAVDAFSRALSALDPEQQTLGRRPTPGRRRSAPGRRPASGGRPARRPAGSPRGRRQGDRPAERTEAAALRR